MRIDTYLMKDGRLEIAYAHWIFAYVVPNIVRFPIGSRLDAGSSHPHGEGVGMVIPSVETFKDRTVNGTFASFASVGRNTAALFHPSGGRVSKPMSLKTPKKRS